VDVADQTHYSLINARTAVPHVVLLLLPYVDHDLEDTEWVISKMKADTSHQHLVEGNERLSLPINLQEGVGGIK
jgi:hypothetical protein